MREDMTAGYLVIDVERLRPQMQRISDRFLELMDLSVSNVYRGRLLAGGAYFLSFFGCLQISVTS